MSPRYFKVRFSDPSVDWKRTLTFTVVLSPEHQERIVRRVRDDGDISFDEGLALGAFTTVLSKGQFSHLLPLDYEELSASEFRKMMRSRGRPS